MAYLSKADLKRRRDYNRKRNGVKKPGLTLDCNQSTIKYVSDEEYAADPDSFQAIFSFEIKDVKKNKRRLREIKSDLRRINKDVEKIYNKYKRKGKR